jgi:multidrug efflux pump
VGLITLVGLVSKNGILIVQFANHLQETGLDKLTAAIDAAGTRLRPILMTTAATVVVHFPLVTATGRWCGITAPASRAASTCATAAPRATA